MEITMWEVSWPLLESTARGEWRVQTGPKEKLGCDAVSVKTSLNLTGHLSWAGGAEMFSIGTKCLGLYMPSLASFGSGLSSRSWGCFGQGCFLQPRVVARWRVYLGGISQCSFALWYFLSFLFPMKKKWYGNPAFQVLKPSRVTSSLTLI